MNEKYTNFQSVSPTNNVSNLHSLFLNYNFVICNLSKLTHCQIYRWEYYL